MPMIKKIKSISNTVWGIIIGVGAVGGTFAVIWGVSAFWHGYTSAEMIHEMQQDEEILAGKQDRTQQRIEWLQRQVIEYTKMYGCDMRWVQPGAYTPDPPGSHQCKGVVWEQFQKIVHDLHNMNKKLNKMTGG